MDVQTLQFPGARGTPSRLALIALGGSFVCCKTDRGEFVTLDEENRLREVDIATNAPVAEVYVGPSGPASIQ
jgi:hypothetical protein